MIHVGDLVAIEGDDLGMIVGYDGGWLVDMGEAVVTAQEVWPVACEQEQEEIPF